MKLSQIRPAGQRAARVERAGSIQSVDALEAFGSEQDSTPPTLVAVPEPVPQPKPGPSMPVVQAGPIVPIAAAALLGLVIGGLGMWGGHRFSTGRAPATLRIETTTPGVDVLVSGKTVGRTPVSLTLAPGVYPVQLAGPGASATSASPSPAVPPSFATWTCRRWRLRLPAIRLALWQSRRIRTGFPYRSTAWNVEFASDIDGPEARRASCRGSRVRDHRSAQCDCRGQRAHRPVAVAIRTRRAGCRVIRCGRLVDGGLSSGSHHPRSRKGDWHDRQRSAHAPGRGALARVGEPRVHPWSNATSRLSPARPPLSMWTHPTA